MQLPSWTVPSRDGAHDPPMGSPSRPPIAGLPRGLVRRRDERMVAGVCAGVARWLGVDPIVVRLAVCILALGNGAGLVLYLVAWAVLPEDAGTDGETAAPAASPGTRRSSELALAVGCITLGALLLVRWITPFFPDHIVWPAVVAAIGIGLVLARAGDSDRARWREAATRLPGNPVEAFRGGWMVWVRVLVGAGLLIAGIGFFLASNDALAAVGNVGIAVLATILGGALLFSPWVARLVRQLGEERRERIRNEERADMAAHLHDSVLQTLALIQRHADEPLQARSLARRQERELRAWLYDGRRSSSSDAPGALATALDGVADQVEADHGVAVDVVVVGDCPLDDACRGSGGGGARGGPQRRPAQRCGRGVGVRRGDRRAHRGVRPRPGPRIRPRGRQRRPARDHAVDRAPHGPPRWPGPRAERSRRGHRGDLRVGARCGVDTVTPAALTRVFLVDDHRLFLSGVRTELAGRVDIVGEAVDVESAVEGIRNTGPDVVLLDVHLPGGGGRAVIEAVHRTHPAVVFLALSVSDAAEDVIAVIRAGARGYVTKTIAADDLAQAVERVRAGDAVFSPRLAGFVLDAFAGDLPPDTSLDPELDQITPREREVLRLLARGYTYKEIARRLQVSIKTIETHVSSVLRKLQLSSRHELTRWATDRRLV